MCRLRPVEVAPVARARRAAPLVLDERRARLAAAARVLHDAARARRLADAARLGAVGPLGPVGHLAVARQALNRGKKTRIKAKKGKNHNRNMIMKFKARALTHHARSGTARRPFTIPQRSFTGGRRVMHFSLCCSFWACKRWPTFVSAGHVFLLCIAFSYISVSFFFNFLLSQGKAALFDS